MQVTFFLARESDLGHLATLDPDESVAEFRRGERAWILQTFLRLRRAGFPCRLDDRVPSEGIVVFHTKHESELLERHPRGASPLLVGVRGDLLRPLAAEVEILQNGRFADGGTRRQLPHWPQPGLRPRDPARGARLERVAYKGNLDNLHPDFLSERWRAFLAARDIEWILDGQFYDGETIGSAEIAWDDFRQLDAMLARRPPSPVSDESKPATKLINAWLAGVPALLGPEYAFRELRRSELDYLEIDSLAAAEAAIDRLRTDAALFSAMVARGALRAGEFGVAATTQRWIELLGVDLPRWAAAPWRAALRLLPLERRLALRDLSHRVAGRAPR